MCSVILKTLHIQMLILKQETDYLNGNEKGKDIILIIKMEKMRSIVI